MAGEVALGTRERRALRHRLAHEYFWHYGYAGLWKHGRHREALGAFWRGLRYHPWDLARWKTLVFSMVRVYAGRERSER
jgi:hypothetical protein